MQTNSNYSVSSSYYDPMVAAAHSVAPLTKLRELKGEEKEISCFVYYDNFKQKYKVSSSHFKFWKDLPSAFEEKNAEYVSELNRKITVVDTENVDLTFFEKNPEFSWGVLIKLQVPTSDGREKRISCVVDVKEFLEDYPNLKLDPGKTIEKVLKAKNSIGSMVLFTKDERNEIDRVFVDEKRDHLYSIVDAVGKCDFKSLESTVKSGPLKQLEWEFFSDFLVNHTNAKLVLIPSETAAKVEQLFYASFGIPAPVVKVKTKNNSCMGGECTIS